MYKHYEYCPHCQGIRSTTLSVSLKKLPDPDGVESDYLVFNYHCDTCLTFIRSQEKEMYAELQFSGISPYLS
jgi:hypothetical protein